MNSSPSNAHPTRGQREKHVYEQQVKFLPESVNKFSFHYCTQPTMTSHDFLKELDIQEENLGVYYGQWAGSGSVYTSVSPIGLFFLSN